MKDGGLASREVHLSGGDPFETGQTLFNRSRAGRTGHAINRKFRTNLGFHTPSLSFDFYATSLIDGPVLIDRPVQSGGLVKMADLG